VTVPLQAATVKTEELDELTLARAQRGDEPARRALVLRYQDPVFALLWRLLGGTRRQAMVEDVAQETFLRVFRELPRFVQGGPARLSTWIFTIATRLALMELRRRPLRDAEVIDQHAEFPAPTTAQPDHLAERRALADAIERALAALPDRTRAVVVLRDYHEFEYAEIAEMLDLDLGTVKSRLFRGRMALRKALKDVER
jgi:RNA polymerase sigma-70 factor (ECF subfamily)